MEVKYFGPENPEIPIEMVTAICSYLHLKERAKLARISRCWNQFCKEIGWTKGFLTPPISRSEQLNPKYVRSTDPEERCVACHGGRIVSLPSFASKSIRLWREENGSYKVERQIDLPREVSSFYLEDWAFALTATHIVFTQRAPFNSGKDYAFFWYPYTESSAAWDTTQISTQKVFLKTSWKHLVGYSLQGDEEFFLFANGGNYLSMFALPNATRGFLYTTPIVFNRVFDSKSADSFGWAFSNGLIALTWACSEGAHLNTRLAKYTHSAGGLKEERVQCIKMEPCSILTMALSASHFAFLARSQLDSKKRRGESGEALHSSETALNIYAHFELKETPVLVFRKSLESSLSGDIFHFFGGSLFCLNPIRNSARNISIRVQTWSFWPEEESKKFQFSIEKPERDLYPFTPHLGGSWDPENGRVVLYLESGRPRSGILQLWEPKITIDKA